MIPSRKKYRDVLIAGLILSVIFLVSPTPAEATGWPPGTYMGYAEDGDDMDNNPYYYSGSFSSSGERKWFYWQEELFQGSHVSHYIGIWVDVDPTLDVVINVVRNSWWYDNMRADAENDGGQGYDEHWGTGQYTYFLGDEPSWDGVYIAFNIYCQSGSGDYDLTVFITDS